MGYAELRFDEMVRELRENNRLLGKLVILAERAGKNRQKTANRKIGKNEKSS